MHASVLARLCACVCVCVFGHLHVQKPASFHTLALAANITNPQGATILDLAPQKALLVMVLGAKFHNCSIYWTVSGTLKGPLKGPLTGASGQSVTQRLLVPI